MSVNNNTEELQQQAGVFKRNATELKKRMWWKNLKVIIYAYLTSMNHINVNDYIPYNNR
jgi:ferric iron reductase protein FhuF